MLLVEVRVTVFTDVTTCRTVVAATAVVMVWRWVTVLKTGTVDVRVTRSVEVRVTNTVV